MRRLPLLLLYCLVAAAAVSLPACRRPPEPLSPELATPALALEALEASGVGDFQKIFFNADAAPALLSRFPGAEAMAKEYENAAYDPAAWRALDRERRFAAVLLIGDPARFRPLLDHLRQSPDWTLTNVDPVAITFRRSPAPAWGASRLDALKARFASRPKEEAILLRTQIAHRLLALEEPAAARALLDEALALDPASPAALTEAAFTDAANGRWDEALAHAGKALQADPASLPAQAVKAEALFAHGRFNEALALTRALYKAQPQDGTTLRLHAKVAHAAHAYREEVEALQKLIALSTARHLPAGNWRIYLAQAHAATGNPEAALEQFELALKEPGLTEPERAFVNKGIEQIRGRKPIF